MCLKAAEVYDCSPLPNLEELIARARSIRRPPLLVVGQGVSPAVGGSGGEEKRKVCLCSPTTHPGSFRCRFHHEDYVWCSSMKLSYC